MGRTGDSHAGDAKHRVDPALGSKGSEIADWQESYWRLYTRLLEMLEQADSHPPTEQAAGGAVSQGLRLESHGTAELGARARQLEAQLRQREAALQRYKAMLARVNTSRSWRLTAPLRALGRLVRGSHGDRGSAVTSLAVPVTSSSGAAAPPPPAAGPASVGQRTAPSPAPALAPAPQLQVVEGAPWPASEPIISVIIPCYNYGSYLEETVASVKRQTLQRLEILVVNDGSTDADTLAILQRLNAPPVQVVQQENQGVSVARNKGIALAGGKFICCLDADDTLEPTYLEKCVTLLEANPGLAFAYPWVQEFGRSHNLWRTEPFDLFKMLKYDHVSTCAVFLRSAWAAVGGYATDMSSCEDWEFWLRLGAAGYRGACIPEPLHNYRQHGSSKCPLGQRRLAVQVIRHNEELLTEPGRIAEIQSRYLDLTPTQCMRNLADPAFFRQSARPALLFITHAVKVGGVETMLYDIIKGLVQQARWEPFLATFRSSNAEWLRRFYELAPNGYELVHFLPERAYNDFLINLLRTRGIRHVVITNTLDGYTALPHLKRAVPDLHVVDILHTREPFMFDKTMGAIGDLDGVIVVNQAIADKLERTGQVDMSRVHMLGHGVDVVGMFDPARYDRAHSREELGLPLDKKIVTWIGRLSEAKQPLHFLEMAAQLRSCRDALFMLAGNGSERDVVEDGIERLKLGDMVRWLPGVEHALVPKVLAASDALVITSRFEGGPMVLYEALAMNVPVVTYNVGQAPLVVRQGLNGYIVPAQNTALLTERVAALLSDAKLLASMREHGHGRAAVVEGGFTSQQMVQRYSQFFQQWLQG